ncbi:hypothetical protein BDP27DRAFT_1426550 [Rhodocollybia butyracea]|uniref:Uncharacterized protein n=1 Tax=Rhodocollybia butyracea TaxID=206335 RepID=A0A9P5PIE3_9AGAR|nr:hypothetical protein BDP27DRAFT_1426533 [Rhodocollybia butyracea]KAF9063803.1 hypothetical protein BDP27DRAFT_1426550 [Rhodocollybia butyracea]
MYSVTTKGWASPSGQDCGTYIQDAETEITHKAITSDSNSTGVILNSLGAVMHCTAHAQNTLIQCNVDMQEREHHIPKYTQKYHRKIQLARAQFGYFICRPFAFLCCSSVESVDTDSVPSLHSVSTAS